MKATTRTKALSIVSALALAALVGCGGSHPAKSATPSSSANSAPTTAPSTTSSETQDSSSVATPNEKGSASSSAQESGKDSATTTPSNPTPSASANKEAQLENDARSKGLYVLRGRAHAHYEDWSSGKGSVISITLDEPVQYEFTYKGSTSTLTAKEVEVALESSANYKEWAAYDGQHVVISCESLIEAIHDASMRNVDAIAKNPAVLYTL